MSESTYGWSDGVVASGEDIEGKDEEPLSFKNDGMGDHVEQLDVELSRATLAQARVARERSDRHQLFPDRPCFLDGAFRPRALGIERAKRSLQCREQLAPLRGSSRTQLDDFVDGSRVRDAEPPTRERDQLVVEVRHVERFIHVHMCDGFRSPSRRLG